MAFRGHPRHFAPFRGLPWPSVALRGLPWPPMAFHGLPCPLPTLLMQPPAVTERQDDTEEQKRAADENELHVIVLDEFDAIARRRSSETVGGNEGGTAARDSVVNQLLALMDGVASLPVPTFVIALTNRRELVDSAVLRPGRLEVHVPVGKPDVKGRQEILRIHAQRMRESGRLNIGAGPPTNSDECTLSVPDEPTYGAWLARLADATGGFSGAAIAALVRGAIARALDRSVEQNDADGCRVTEDDFRRAINDLRTSSLELEARWPDGGISTPGEVEAVEQLEAVES